jgi:5-formyltetrahydrofolate cyclo-ligase
VDGTLEEAKRRLRAEMRERLRALPPEVRADAGPRLAGHALALVVGRGARVVGLYAPTGSEARQEGLPDALRALGAAVLYPRVREDGTLGFHRVDRDDLLVPGFRGISEPPATLPEVLPGHLDLVFVPGLAFDGEGRRLGRGGGHFDRFLARPDRPFACGVAWACQVVPEVPGGPRDEPVDAVVTEDGLLTFTRPA